MNRNQNINYTNFAQVTSTLCGWVRVAEMSLPIATNVIEQMAKDFGHDPGGSDG
ncbi:MAG: hypothetical protein AAF541_04685 [Pseudomonadota bacterium]